ncbi:sensor histidine kinase [Cellulomonas palmilytica]|uniref:sensor histidine kinase n=1 Tax=Cellulomonas palmilytica TaxID=2608402 RepID=UPI001F1801C8|nr:sensor histidine kinase [Cellulomonas palmilytica]UJP40171.1 sensor histidine kinase [Cellulomonas palmilytica]
MTSQLAPGPKHSGPVDQGVDPIDAAFPPTSRDLATVAPALADGSRFALAPVSSETWRAVAQTTVGFVWLLTVGTVALIVVPVAASFIFVFGIGLLMLPFVLLGARWFARAELGRLEAQTGVVIPRAVPYRSRGAGRWSRFFAPLRDKRAWAAFGYAALSVLTSSLAFAFVVGLGGAGLAGILAPVYGTGPLLEDWFDGPTWLLGTGLVILGIVAVWLAAITAQAASLLHVRMARGMLGASRSAYELAVADAARARAESRVAHVEETRHLVVGAADDERRRIERDLHDGAQQRLVALGLELGAAKRRGAQDPEAAAAALDHAHREIQETLSELRDLVRGIHPAVLTDRGLDAALSALASRSPIPVTVRTPDDDTLEQCGTSARAAAYFVVAEALTNVAKHAQARSAQVAVACDGTTLRLVVSDDGRGGAVLAPGSGLDGLRSRVAALDGTFELASPAGAGTTLTVELPCAS